MEKKNLNERKIVDKLLVLNKIYELTVLYRYSVCVFLSWAGSKLYKKKRDREREKANF